MKKEKTIRARIQIMGGFLTNMVIPNMGAFIAWGLVIALFIPTGWIPNEVLEELVGPTITYLLPILLAYTGGQLVGGKDGAIMGSLGAMGLIIGSEIPMFLGAMVAGPLGGLIMKKINQISAGKVRAGFEMVVSNFTLGIVGMLYMILCFKVIGPVIVGINDLITVLVDMFVQTGILPLLSIINEPAKVLFLNNVIDQGIYYPLGMQQTLEAGKSIFFMVASNPGPGLGVLLAFTLFGQGAAKKTAPGAIIIHFLGGIHEVYFPYVLMKPKTIIAMILGAMSGITVFQLLDVGLVAGPSPGSIVAYLLLTPKGSYFGVILGVAVATLVSFLICAAILKLEAKRPTDDEFEENSQKSQAMKSAGKIDLTNKQINFVAYACDAGLGSSAMGASIFKKRLSELGYHDIKVDNYRIESVPKTVDYVIIHQNLVDRANEVIEVDKIIAIENYLKDDAIDKVIELIQERQR